MGPRIATAAMRIAAMTRLKLDRNLIPASRPVATEMAARPAMTTTNPTSIPFDAFHPVRCSVPPANCLTPKPSDMAIPKIVPTMATMSMTSPTRPLMRSPKIGLSVHRIETGMPLRYTA